MAERAYPVPDADSQPFWDGAERGELRIQRCDDCGEHVFYPRAVCPRCGGDRLDWVTARGEGTVHSFTVVHRAAPVGFADAVPYTVGLVDLDEGVRLMASLETGACIGQRVHLHFARVEDAEHPQWILEGRT